MTPSQPLHAMHCVPCEGGTQPLRHDEFQQYLPIIPSWTVASDEKSIHKKFQFGNFRSALQFGMMVYVLVGVSGVYQLVTHKKDCKVCK